MDEHVLVAAGADADHADPRPRELLEPANAQAYVRRLEELSGARISVIGVGPGRDENVVINDLID